MLTSKSIQLSDYDNIQDGLAAAYYSNGVCIGAGVPVYIPHAHRLWEYGSALQELIALDSADPYFHVTSVLDIGCGHSILGPAAFFVTGAAIHEVEPKESVTEPRSDLLPALLHKKYTCENVGLLESAAEQHTAVFCISVMEHLPRELQEKAWKTLAQRVAPGGLLAVTVDCSNSQAGDPRERETMFSTDDVAQAIAWLQSEGLAMGDVDLNLHPPQVNDYTFFRILARRPA